MNMNSIHERHFQHGDAARWRARFPRVPAHVLVQYLTTAAMQPETLPEEATAPPATCCTAPFDLKSLDETGEFEGLAAVYRIRDGMGDEIEPGAFTKTLHALGGKVPILFHHDPTQVLGIGELIDTPTGLKILGKLNLGVARAREIYALLKQRAVTGLSIGFRTVQSTFVGTVRHVREIALHEVSLTAFPAQALATVSAVKSAPESEEWDDQSGETAFLATLREMQQDMKTRTEGGH